MTRDEAKQVQVGDVLRPLPLWNVSDTRKLADVVEVKAIKETKGSQTGVLFKVDTISGPTIVLDAGWFER